MSRLRAHHYAATLLLGGTLSIAAPAQQISGSASVSAETYQQTGLTTPRRPAQSLLLTGTLNVALVNGVSIPLSFYASTEGSGYQQPFNQVGVSPRWSWGTAHGGYFSTQFSELTLQSARLLGGGVELEPGPFRLAVVTGVSQQAQAADSAAGIIGLARQTLTAGQVGFGHQGKALLWLTFLQAADDPGGFPSTSTSLLSLAPRENLVGSLRVAIPIRSAVMFEGEVAGSAFSDDVRSPELDSSDLNIAIPSSVRSLFAPRTSSRFDGAGLATLRITPAPQFAVGFVSRYVGPGYRSLGAPQLEADVLDLTVQPQIQLPKASLNLNVGQRRNNLANSRGTTTTRAILDALGMVQLREGLSVSGTFSNYGMRAPNPNDTLVIDNVSLMASVTPSIRFRTGSLMHDLQVGYGFQNFTDRNVLTGRQADNRTHGFSGTHTLVTEGGLSFSTTGTDTRGVTGGVLTAMQSIGESIGLQLFGRRVGLTASGAYSWTLTSQLDFGYQGSLRANIKLDPKRQQLQLSGQFRRFDYGRPRGSSTGFTETQLRAGYTLTF